MRNDESERALLEFAEQNIMLSGDTNIPALAGRIPINSSIRSSTVEFGARFRSLPSGLLAPESAIRPPAPIDRVYTYLTIEQIFGLRPSSNYLAYQLSNASVVEILFFVAKIMTALRNPEKSNSAVDKEFAAAWFHEPIRSKVLHLLDSGRRVLAAPQAAIALLKLALLYSPREPHEIGSTRLPGALLAVSSLLNASETEGEENFTISNSPGFLGRELISNQHFNGEIDTLHLMARCYRRWFGRDGEELERDYLDATGVPLRDALTIVLVLWSRSIKGSYITPLSYLAGLHGWSKARSQRALALFSTDLSSLSGHVRAETKDYGIAWANGALERFPVVKLDDETLVVVDPGILVRRMFGWLPYWDVMNGLQPLDKRRAGEFSRKIRANSEAYIGEILQEICGNSSRLYFDTELKSRLGRSKLRIADAAIDYGDSWVVVEVTTSQLRREAAYGVSDDAVESDLDKLVDEAKQIASTISALRTRHAQLTGYERGSIGPQFYPLLVMAEGFPVNPISITLIRERLQNKDILQGSDIAPLEIIDTVELEMIEYLQCRHGPSLRDLLRNKPISSLSRTNMRQYILDELRLKPKRSQRVNSLWQAMFDLLIEPLRPIAER